jgi:hypothetical protein
MREDWMIDEFAQAGFLSYEHTGPPVDAVHPQRDAPVT